MTTNECKTIQQELDEAEANEPMSAKAADHLRSCDECRRFDSDQRTLHGLIASLEPVAAPPDFDFRLRARIAREKSRDRSSVGLSSFLRIPRAVAVVSLILLVAVAGVIVKNWMTSPTRTVAVAPSQPQNEPSKTTRTPQITNSSVTGTIAAKTPSDGNPTRPGRRSPAAPKNNGLRSSQTVARKGEANATRDFTVSPAPVVTGNQAENAGSIVRVPMDGKALQILIDDGRGATRTISLPTVSFGSQRLMTGQSFMPSISPAKGVW